MSFPEDKKIAMRDCILKLLWPKDDIVAFFKNNSCTTSDIKAPSATLPDLNNKFIALLQGDVTDAKRGYAFEDVLQTLAKLSSLDATEPFRVNGEQIDGSVKYDGEPYLVEAKRQDKAVSNEAVYQFAGKKE
jgi:hypothetical protein